MNSSSLASIVEFSSQSLVVILSGGGGNQVGFRWTSESGANSNSPFELPFVTTTNYLQGGGESGGVVWKESEAKERSTFVFNFENSGDGSGKDSKVKSSVNLDLVIDFDACSSQDPCECSYLGLFEVLAGGVLREVTR